MKSILEKIEEIKVRKKYITKMNVEMNEKMEFVRKKKHKEFQLQNPAESTFCEEIFVDKEIGYLEFLMNLNEVIATPNHNTRKRDELLKTLFNNIHNKIIFFSEKRVACKVNEILDIQKKIILKEFEEGNSDI
jgi:transcriptional regulator with PAS, ATPase and Fis domain